MFTTKSTYNELPGPDAIDKGYLKAGELMANRGSTPVTEIEYDENENAIAIKRGWPDRETAQAWIDWVLANYQPQPISWEIVEE